MSCKANNTVCVLAKITGTIAIVSVNQFRAVIQENIKAAPGDTLADDSDKVFDPVVVHFFHK